MAAHDEPLVGLESVSNAYEVSLVEPDGNGPAQSDAIFLNEDVAVLPFSKHRKNGNSDRTGIAFADEHGASNGVSPYDFGHWQILPAARSAQRDGESLELTSRDLEVLAFFVREQGHILSRRRLLAEIWGYPDPDRIETRSVDMHIAKLRKKLGPTDGALIETVRGEGYRYRG